MSTDTSKTKIWIQAARLRTLPLAFASIILGSMIAAFYGNYQISAIVLALLTTLFLQVLSNFANDYGDTINGADHKDREGPSRAVQTGLISLSQMRNAMILFSVLSFISGLMLIHISFSFLGTSYIVFVLLLLLCVYASITYTSGKNPYGYMALGDISVFLFFGVFGVALNAYLHLNHWHGMILLPAAAIGLLSTGVLNLNNMRDVISDKQAGKNTIAIILGFQQSKNYHYTLVILPFVLVTIFVISEITDLSIFNFIYFICLPIVIKQIITIKNIKYVQHYDPLLKTLALTTLLFCITTGLSLLL